MTNLVGETELAAILSDLRDAAVREILPRFLKLGTGAIRTKTAPDDVVTDADIGAERMLSEAFAQRFPGAVIVGEEAVAADPGLLDELGKAELVVVIDPVDGTWNFAHGLPVFGSMMAVIAEGITVAGVIHYPLTGDYIAAIRGQGAWHIGADGARTNLRVAAPVPISRMAGLVPLPQMPPNERALVAPRVAAFAQTTTYRCSAYEYRLLVQAAIHFSLNAHLQPWDHAAGQLIHTEAGGYSAVLPGIAYHPGMTNGRLLLAPDKASWEAVRQALLPEIVWTKSPLHPVTAAELDRA